MEIKQENTNAMFYLKTSFEVKELYLAYKKEIYDLLNFIYPLMCMLTFITLLNDHGEKP